MRHLFFILLFILFHASAPAAEESILAVACGDDKVVIFNPEKSDSESPEIVWQWSVPEAQSQLPNSYQKRMIPLDECKSVDNNSKLLLTSSGGGVLLLERKTKKCLFFAYVPMAHSADLLPDNKIAVALSSHKNGNSIEIYDISKPEQVLFRNPLRSGHGAVWNPKLQKFYALGFDELQEFSLKDWQTEKPQLEMKRKWTIPVRSGHDLSLISDNELLVSGHEGVVLFNIEQEKFSPFKQLELVQDVKSVNYNKNTGRIFYTKSEENWWTHYIYQINPYKKWVFPKWNIYKVRVIEQN